MKKTILPLLLYIAFIFFSGCNYVHETNPEVSDTTVSADEEIPVPDYWQPVDYTWNPYVLSDIYAKLYGDAFVDDYKSMIDAFLSYEGSFACSSVECAEAINTVSSSCFPLLDMDVGFVEYDETKKVGILNYVWPKEDHNAGIEAFKASITWLITSSVMKSDNELTTALALYMKYSSIVSYDYAAAESDVIVDLSSYRALTTYEGICQSFGPAYAYLCLQMGIDAVTAGGLSIDDTAHEWTLVKLDGSYFYMDTTFENGDGGYGLKYFGMTSADRVSAGNYIAELFNIGGTNQIWGPEIDATDERFSALRNVSYAVLNRELNQIDCTDSEGIEWAFPLE